jgi:hypothetical protein
LLAVSTYVFDGIFSCSDLVENKEEDKTRQLKIIDTLHGGIQIQCI